VGQNRSHIYTVSDKPLTNGVPGRKPLISILYVDDEEMFLEIAKDYLERSGDLAIDTANSVYRAMEMLERTSYDVVISDYQMPGLTGIDLLKYIRQKDDQMPFLLFTGRGREEVAIEALNNGADFYLQKDSHFRSQFVQLEHEIREATRRRYAERERTRMESVLRIKDAAIRSALSPIAISDSVGRLLYVNPVCLATWGYSDEKEVIGRQVTEFVNDPAAAFIAIRELRNEGRWLGEVVARKRDGSTFDAKVSASMIVDESGEPAGMVASFTDLTEQKRAWSRLESYVRDLKFISEKATEMADYPLDANIFEYIAGALHSLAPPGAIVLVNSINVENVTVRIEAIRGADPYLPAVEQMLGRPPAGLTFQASLQGMKEMLLGSFVDIPGGLRELTFGQMPEEICREIDSLPFMGSMKGAGLSWKGKVYGIAILLLPPGTMPEHPDILDMFVRHAASVLQRRHAEQALLERKD
jgi:PAS domain S-box-containing protein